MLFDDNEALKSFLIGETLLCGLLGRVLYEEPKKSFLEQLIREDVFSEVPFGCGQENIERGLEILKPWVEKNKNGLSDEEFKEIQRDHLYLFIGVEKTLAPVWESVYFSEDRMLFQEQTLKVRQWYSRFGLRFERLSQEPDDHIGVELSFISHLASLALQALIDGKMEIVETLLFSQYDFLRKHPAHWVSIWAGLVETHARTDFYQGLAILTQGSLMAVMQELEQYTEPEKIS